MPKTIPFLAFLLLASATSARAEDAAQWLTYTGGDGPGAGKHIVFVTGDESTGRANASCDLVPKAVPQTGSKSSTSSCRPRRNRLAKRRSPLIAWRRW